MPAASHERLRRDLVASAHHGPSMPELARDVARAVSRAVPFDGICLLAMDPATLLPTGEIVENGLPAETLPRLIEIELGGTDFNAFRALAHAPSPAATLSAATGGELERSVRHRELKRPHGFGDELRAVLTDDGATWGALTLLRGADRPPFSAADTALLASVSPLLAEGLRRATLGSAVATRPGADNDEQPGLALLAADNSLDSADDSARRWLAELGADAPSLPAVVTAVATRARAGGDTREIARARIRTASGAWLTIRGWTVGAAGTAVLFERARPHELAPLIAEAYELTDREREVTQLVAQGCSTDAIAARLFLSPWTIQDHLKVVFEKTGVSTRGELVARLFFEHYAPRLTDE